MSDATTETFNRLRPRLQGIAYRMLGSSAEAEDIVQDAWLRWHAADTDSLGSTEAWLVSAPRAWPLTGCAPLRSSARTMSAHGCRSR